MAPLRSMQMLEEVPDPDISIRCSKLGKLRLIWSVLAWILWLVT